MTSGNLAIGVPSTLAKLGLLFLLYWGQVWGDWGEEQEGEVLTEPLSACYFNVLAHCWLNSLFTYFTLQYQNTFLILMHMWHLPIKERYMNFLFVLVQYGCIEVGPLSSKFSNRGNLTILVAYHAEVFPCFSVKEHLNRPWLQFRKWLSLPQGPESEVILPISSPHVLTLLNPWLVRWSSPGLCPDSFYLPANALSCLGVPTKRKRLCCATTAVKCHAGT